MRVVIDTNVVLSSLLFATGRLFQIRVAWQHERIIPLASADTTSELLRVLHYPKFALNANDRREILAEYLPWCETFAEVPAVDAPDLGDPSDRIFLDLATAGAADAVVTGDSALLAYSSQFAIPIMTGRELIRLLE